MTDYYNDAQINTQETRRDTSEGARRKSVKGRIAQCLIWLAVGMAGAACSTTTAPTDSSTNTLDKISNTTLDATSSTSPGSSPGDSAAIERFVAVNYGPIRHEMAAGQGEHLQALAVLLEVPADKHRSFCSLSKQYFPYLYSSTPTSPEQMLDRLQVTMGQHPGLVN